MNRQEKYLEQRYNEYKQLDLHNQIDYDKFYLYSLVSHSTAIEGSTYTPEQASSLFETGFVPYGKTLVETYMNSDLKYAYDYAFRSAKEQKEITPDFIKELSSLILKNTGSVMNTPLGTFDASKGEYRLCNVTAGIGGRSYIKFNKIEKSVFLLCDKLKKTLIQTQTITQFYKLSFSAHLELATIHPFLDGNGRLARLVMHYIQACHNLLPVNIYTQKKADYIEALRKTQTNEDEKAFEKFMIDITIENLNNEIEHT